MPTQIISVKFFAAALVAASIGNPLWASRCHYFAAQAVDAPVSPSSSPKDSADLSSDKMRQQRQKSRPSNKRQGPPQKQQLQQQQEQNLNAENDQQIPLKEKQQHQMKHVPQHTAKSEYDAYMHWCEAVLGIRSMVEIKEFEYVDHLRILWQENENEARNTDPNDFEWLQKYSTSGSVDDHINNEKSAKTQTQTEMPTKMVRGLAAKHDIAVGDIVISIPLYSLLSVPTTIDHDPVLSRILGPKAREKYGWTDTIEYEIPLLVIAVLHHRSLGMESPLSHYIDVLLATPTDFPFLWSDQTLRDNTDKIGEGVKKLARGIKKDLHEMYDKIMGKLVTTEHSDLFSPPTEDSLEEWMYSYENFQWAFAVVISRHHYLPIQDLDYEKAAQSELVSGSNEVVQTTPHTNVETTQSDSTVSEVVPPANQPTDSWVELAKNEEKVVDDAVVEDQDRGIPADDDIDDDIIAPSGFFKHSFLAPLADMINFGPPCLTGSYNPDEHVFELIATCPVKAGQEVTFYYSSECADVIIANYAFLHPLVPPCATIDEVKEKSEEWKNQLMDTEEKLWKAHRQVDILKGEILALESQLQSCESGDDKVNGKKEYPFPHSKTVGDEMSSDSETTPSHQKLRKEGQPSRNHEVGVRGRIHEPSRQEFDEQIMEELG